MLPTYYIPEMTPDGGLDFATAVARAKGSGQPLSLIVGNGLSIAFDRELFDYRSLFDGALIRGTTWSKTEMAQRFGTRDFEAWIRELNHLASMGGESDVKAERLRRDADLVRQALAEVLARHHPDRATRLLPAQSASVRQFLTHFESVFTLNYDLLLYWATLKDSGTPVPLIDGFIDSSDEFAAQRWDHSFALMHQQITYLHGALHLFSGETGDTYKLTYRAGSPLKDQLIDRMRQGQFPLVVAEGTSEEKLAAIEAHAYLRDGMRRWRAKEGVIFFHGLSFSLNDAHVTGILGDPSSRITEAYVSLFGDWDSVANRAIREAVDRSLEARSDAGGDRIPVEYYRAESTRAWDNVEGGHITSLRLKRHTEFALSPSSASQCPHSVHLRWDETAQAVPRRLDGGSRIATEARAFTEQAMSRLASVPGARLLAPNHSAGQISLEGQTLQAMREGAPFIVGGRLPADDEHRKGSPSALMLTSAEGADPTYIPVIVKPHKILKTQPSGSITISALQRPAVVRSVSGHSIDVGERLADLYEIAHLSRLLQRLELGERSEQMHGCLLTTDALSGPVPAGEALIWVDVKSLRSNAFSHRVEVSRPAPTILDRYDREFEARVTIASTAVRRLGGPGDPQPLTAPLGCSLCDRCAWFDHCEATVDDGAAHWHIRHGRLDETEWRALHDLDIRSLSQLAEAADSNLDLDYLPKVKHRGKGARKRLIAAMERASLLVNGEAVRFRSYGPEEIPSADIEIDIDTELSADNRSYLWGAWVRTPEDPVGRYVGTFVDWGHITEVGEAELTGRFAAWLLDQVTEAEASGRTIRIFHYSGPEEGRLKKALSQERFDILKPCLRNLKDSVELALISSEDYKLKFIGRSLGYRWRDDEAGGLESQEWHQIALLGSEHERLDARKRLLEYNEDDVHNTALVRDSLRRRSLSPADSSA